jgi:glycosyltransferase involved in cell wall biosynthesis
VVVLVSSMNRGGKEMRLLDVLRGLDPRRYEASLGVLHGGGLLAEGLPAAVRVRTRLARFRGDPLAALRVARLVRSERADLVWCAGSDFLAVLGQLAARAAGVPAVVSVHGLDRPEDRVFGPLARHLVRYPARFLVLSEGYRARLVAEGVRPGQVVVQLNGVDTSRYAPLKGPRPPARLAAGLPADAPLVGHVGHMGVRKAQHVLLEAFARVRASRPAARLVMVGDGPLRGRLEEQVASLGLGGAVSMLGERDDVPALMPLFDVFVLSSLMEGCPNAAIEAMSAGVPVVATDAGGTREVVGHGETGYVVPVNDPPALAAAILDVLADPRRAAALGQSGRRRALAAFGAARMVKERMDLFDEILAQEA